MCLPSVIDSPSVNHIVLLYNDLMLPFLSYHFPIKELSYFVSLTISLLPFLFKMAFSSSSHNLEDMMDETFDQLFDQQFEQLYVQGQEASR